MSTRIYRIDIVASLLPKTDTPPSGQHVAVTIEKLHLEDGRHVEVYRLSATPEHPLRRSLDQSWLERFPYFNPIISGYDLIREPDTCSGFLLRLKNGANIGQLADYAADIECALIPT